MDILLGTELRVCVAFFKKTPFFCLFRRVPHFGTFLDLYVASTVGYKQLDDKYAANVREEKEKTSKTFPHIIQLGAPVYVQVSAIFFLPLIG